MPRVVHHESGDGEPSNIEQKPASRHSLLTLGWFWRWHLGSGLIGTQRLLPISIWQ